MEEVGVLIVSRQMPVGPRHLLSTTAYRNVQRFRDGLVLKAHRLLYHPNLGLRVIKKTEDARRPAPPAPRS